MRELLAGFDDQAGSGLFWAHPGSPCGFENLTRLSVRCEEARPCL